MDATSMARFTFGESLGTKAKRRAALKQHGVELKEAGITS